MKELKQFNDCLARIKQGEQLFLLQLEWDMLELLFSLSKFVVILLLFSHPIFL